MRFLEYVSQTYYSNKEIKEVWDEIFNTIDNIYDVPEIENFKMEYICYGKVVFLKRNEVGSSRFRGNSAFWVKYASERGKRRRYIPLSLYSDSNILKDDIYES